MKEREKKKDRGFRERVKRRVITGVKFLTGERTVVEREQIASILPHRGGKLFLDQVVITARKIIGELTIRPEHCQDHEIGGKPVLRGVDYPEMAAQLLGIWLSQQALQYPEFHGKIAALRKSSFKCIGPSFPGDLLRMEIPIIERNEEEEEEGSPRIDSVGRQDRPMRLRQQAIAINTEAWVGDKKRAVIYFVELGIGDIKSLA